MRYVSPKGINLKVERSRVIGLPSSLDGPETPGRIQSLFPSINLFFNTHHRSVLSPIRSIITIASVLIALSFITVTLNGNIQGHTSSSRQKGIIQRITGFADALPILDSKNKISEISNYKDEKGANLQNDVTENISNSSPEKETSSTSKQAEATKSSSNYSSLASTAAKNEHKKKISSSIKQNESILVKEKQQTSNATESAVSDKISNRRSKAKAFIVVFLGHSGSTAFITELGQHPEVEVKIYEPLDHDEYEFDTELSLKYAREILDEGIANGKIPGFKIRPLHIRNQSEAFQKLAKEYDLRIFWQFRVNIMKQAIGEYRHRILNDTSVVEGLKKDETACDKSSGYRCQFRIDDISALHELLNDFSINDELLGEAVRLLKRDNDMLAVKYEDYLYRRSEVIRDSLDFLGIAQRDTQPLRTKASPDSLCGMVINFQEVCRSFYACQLWRPYLDDDRNNCYCRPTNGVDFDQQYCHRNVWYQKGISE